MTHLIASGGITQTARIACDLIGFERISDLLITTHHHIKHSRITIWHILGEHGDFGTVFDQHFTIIGVQIACDELEQGGFAFAISSDQANAFIRLKAKIHPVQNRCDTKGQVDIFELY